MVAFYWVEIMKTLKLLLATLFTIALNGYTQPVKPVINQHVFTVVIQEDKTLKNHGGQQYVGGRCVIKLREYPICLQHEVRHCIEGNWHEGIETTDGCFE